MADQQPQPSPSRQESKVRAALRNLRWRAHALAPNLIDSPWGDKAYVRSRDEKDNEETRVDAAEQLRVAAIWGVEVFGPSESDRLYDGLKQLNWSSGIGITKGEALTWARQQRAYGQGGSYNVGLVDRTGGPRRFIGGNQGPVPDMADYMLVQLIQISASITCAVICFVLKEDVATLYEKELNTPRKSRTKRSGRMLWNLSPYHLKEAAIKAVRANLRAQAREWFRAHLPGYFSTSIALDRFPIGELMTSEVTDLMADFKVKPDGEEWRRTLANPSPLDVWTSASKESLRFTMQAATLRDEQENILTVSVVPARLPQKSIDMYGMRPGSIASLCNEEFDGVLAYFGVRVFLSEVTKDIKNTREELDLSSGKQRTLRTIDLIRRFFDRNAGVPAMARELREHTEKPGFVEYYCGKFTSPGWGKDEGPRAFSTEFRKTLHHRAALLLEEEAATREHFGQLATILSTRESIRAQRRMELLTVLALLVAFASLAAAVPDTWTDKLKNVIAELRL